MNKREAKREAHRLTALQIDEWLLRDDTSNLYSDEEYERVEAAMEELRDHHQRLGGS